MKKMIKKSNINVEISKKYALVTGVTSGIGKEIAIYLDELGFNIIAVARNKEKLENLRKILKNNTVIYVADLSNLEEVKKLCDFTKKYNIYILVNNAGCGCYGEFLNVDFNAEYDMINLNLVTPHILMKTILQEMIKNNEGYILNVTSSSAFASCGPFMSSYYATKSYLYTLTNSVVQELKGKKSNVKVAQVCPGPVNTNFNEKLGIKFSVKSLSCIYVARYAVDKLLFSNKTNIVPGIKIQALKILSKITPDFVMNKVNYNIQKKKSKNNRCKK